MSDQLRLGADRDQLVAHLRLDFDKHGRRSADYLETAVALLASGAVGPRLPESACYCVREALKELLLAVRLPPREPWRKISREVVDAKARYVSQAALSDEDAAAALAELLVAVGELEVVHDQERIHQRRLVLLLAERSGSSATTLAPVSAYQSLIDSADSALHSETTLQEARALCDEAFALMRQLFMPADVRLDELRELALTEHPTADNAREVAQRLSSVVHLSYFFSQVVTTEWLQLLDVDDRLRPPQSQDNWAVFTLVEHLNGSFGSALIAWLEDAAKRWGADSRDAWFIARAALDLGEVSAKLVLATVQKHPADMSIASLALQLLDLVDSSSDVVARVCDLTLNAGSGMSRSYGFGQMSERLTRGVTVENWQPRVVLIAHKLRALPDDDRALSMLDFETGGSISEPLQFYGDEKSSLLLAALVGVCREALSLQVAIHEVLEATSGLPLGLIARFRSWLLGTASPLVVDVAVKDIREGLKTRFPTGDDVALVDRIVAECDAADYESEWTSVIGDPPSPESVGEAMAKDEVERDWLRKRRWVAILPAAVGAEWATVSGLLSAEFGPVSREAISTRRQTLGGTGRSPMDAAALGAMAPLDAAAWVAAWRKAPSDDWLVGYRELARTLEEVVKDAPAAWLDAPLQVIGALREPAYVSHYFMGLRRADSLAGLPVAELVQAVEFVSKSPWSATKLGRDTYDYDPTWAPAVDAGIELLKRLAMEDEGFGDQQERAWSVVLRAADPNGIGDPVDPGAGMDDARSSAINSFPTRALEAVFSLAGWERRQAGSVRAEAWSLLDTGLRLKGSQGAQFRSIAAPMLPFLLACDETWVTDRLGLWFGEEAEIGMGQITADLFVKWGRPHPWFFANARELLCDAVQRGVERALSFLLIATVWDLESYDVDRTVAFLKDLGDPMLSAAGEQSARLFFEADADEALVAKGLEIFEAVVCLGRADALHGFGWWSEVKTADRAKWLALTTKAAQIANGNLDWATVVAERACEKVSTDSLSIVRWLLMGPRDRWEIATLAELAVAALKQASDEMREADEFARLRSLLLERGVFEAKDL